MGNFGIPFNSSDELYDKLEITDHGLQRHRSAFRDDKPKTTLPSYPRTLINDTAMGTFLTQELTTPDLDKFHKFLWLCGTQSGTDIAPISEQSVRGRTIIVTENVEMHMLWINDRIYLKSIPRFLLSYAFWDFYLGTRNTGLTDAQKIEVGKAARGYLRSYAYLIRRKLDFQIAQEKGLIPPRIKFSKFVTFIRGFETLENEDISLRYSYGELRLGRLNLWAWLALGRPNYYKTVRHYGDYLAQFYGPVLFIFGIFSVILSSMQVALAVESEPTQSLRRWVSLGNACWVFSVFTLVVVLFLVFILSISSIVRFILELAFAVRDWFGWGNRARNEAYRWKSSWW
jgi:hypothetical protein